MFLALTGSWNSTWYICNVLVLLIGDSEYCLLCFRLTVDRLKFIF